jgi:glutathione synthase
MDPPERINPAADTTFVLLEEAQRRGHQILHCDAAQLSLEGTRPVAVVRPARVDRRAAPAMVLGPPATAGLGEMSAVLMRKDPPYDIDYHYATLFLECARGQTVLVNDPRGLRDANEKLYAMNFPDFVPPSVTTRDGARLRALLGELGGEMIVKPLHGFGGRGVLYLKEGDRNIPSILDTLTDEGRRWVVGQKYLPEARRGDKRIVLLDGEPLGAVLRVPREDEVRGNLHVGGRAEKTSLDERDRAICAALGPRLRADGLHLVGIDVIGPWLTEVNVTSPTGVQEINALDGVRLEAEILDWIEARARAIRS